MTTLTPTESKVYSGAQLATEIDNNTCRFGIPTLSYALVHMGNHHQAELMLQAHLGMSTILLQMFEEMSEYKRIVHSYISLRTFAILLVLAHSFSVIIRW